MLLRNALLPGLLCLLAAASPAQQTARTSAFQGDLGARINAADQQLGSNSGTIVVDAPGEATTPIHIGPGHALQFAAEATFRAHITLGGDNAITCTPKGKIVANLPDLQNHDAILIYAVSVANISVEHCTITAANPGGDYMFLQTAGVSHVRVIDNHADDIPLLFTISVGRTYGGTDSSNMSSDIVFDHNVVTMSAPGYRGHQATAALIFFSRDIQVTHNSFHGGAHGVQYWGGGGNYDWKSEASPRWLQNLVIADNDCSDVRGSCYWGAMGQDVQFLRNRAARCGDACLDIEDNKNVTVDGNILTDGGNGEVALLGRNVHITVTHNSMTSTASTFPLFSHFNNSVDGANSPDITVANNTMVCLDPQINCVIKYDNVQNFVFADNQVTNGDFGPGKVWQKGTTVQGNTFTYTRSSAQKMYAVDVASQINGNTARVIGNTIISNAPQPAGSECIHLESNPPQFAPGHFLAQNNVCTGSAPFQVSLHMVNGGQTGGASFIARENQFAGTILHDDKAGNGHFDIQR